MRIVVAKRGLIIEMEVKTNTSPYLGEAVSGGREERGLHQHAINK